MNAPSPSPSHGWAPVVVALMLLNALPELTLEAAGNGFFGSPNWRLWALSYGALWRGLMFDWKPNFTLQPLTMFLTYGFLHTGFPHLLGNLLGILVLARETLARVGQKGLAAIYAVALIAGAVGFIVLSTSVQPMIGASGAVYGLASAWIYWDWRDRLMAGRSWLPTLALLVALALTNVISWWSWSGQLAWQTHLGGAVGAWICAWWLDPSRRRPRRISDR